MSCNCGPKHGKEFDASCEGPSQADIDRFGYDSDYAEFDDDGLYPVEKTPAQKMKTAATAGVTVIVLVAFVAVFAL